MKTEILDCTAREVDELAAEWNALCDEGPCSDPFFRPEWFSALAPHIKGSCSIITVRSGGRLRAVLPVNLGLARIHGIPVRLLSGIFDLNSQRFGLVHGLNDYEREAVTESIWQKLDMLTGWDVAEFRLVRADSWLTKIIELAESKRYKVGTWPMDSAPFISLLDQDELRSYRSGRRQKLFKELDRRLRRLHELGRVEFQVREGADNQSMNRYFALEAAGWKGRRSTDVLSDCGSEAIHRAFAGNMTKAGSLRAYELKVDGRTIAMSLNLLAAGKLIHWKTSYDENYARYSPGNLLFRRILDDCLRDGFTEIDLMSPASEWKKAWATGERAHVALYTFRPGFLGTGLWNWKFSLASRLRKLMRPEAARVPVTN